MDNLGFYYTVMRNLTSGIDVIMKSNVMEDHPSYQIISNSTIIPLIDSIVIVDPMERMFILSNGNLISYNALKSHVRWISPLKGISKTSQLLFDEDLLFVSFSGGIARINIRSGDVVGYTESNNFSVASNPALLSFDERYIVAFEKKVPTNIGFWMHILDQKFISKGPLNSDILKDKNGKLIDMNQCSNVMSQVDSVIFFCRQQQYYTTYKFDISEDSLKSTLSYQVDMMANSCSKQIARFDHYSYFATVCDSFVYVFSMNSPQIVRKSLNIRTNEDTQIVGSVSTFFVVTPEMGRVSVEMINAKV